MRMWREQKHCPIWYRRTQSCRRSPPSVITPWRLWPSTSATQTSSSLTRARLRKRYSFGFKLATLHQAQKKVQFGFHISYIALYRHRKMYSLGFTSATLHQAQKNLQFGFHISYIALGTEKCTVWVSHQLHCTRHRKMYSLGFMSAHRYPAAWLASGTEKGTVLVSHQPHRHPAAWLPTGIKKVLVQTSHSEIQLLDLLQTQQTMAYNRHSRLCSFGSHQLCRQYNLWQMQKMVQL